jgi:hypothetical protein
MLIGVEACSGKRSGREKIFQKYGSGGKECDGRIGISGYLLFGGEAVGAKGKMASIFCLATSLFHSNSV